jgi:CO dehydrogenase/acetyl-CoA synthase beta subunit
MMNKQIKTFDAVQMMREIRDKISAETEHMTVEELKAYMKRKLAEAKAGAVAGS